MVSHLELSLWDNSHVVHQKEVRGAATGVSVLLGLTNWMVWVAGISRAVRLSHNGLICHVELSIGIQHKQVLTVVFRSCLTQVTSIEALRHHAA